MSSATCAPPTISFADMAAAWSRVFARAGQPAPGSPSGVAATPANSSLACLRVWSSVASGVRVETGRTRVDGEERDAVLTGGAFEASGHDDQVGDVPVDHEHLRTVERVAVARSLGDHLDAVGVPRTLRLGEREGGDGLAGGDAREELRLLVGGTGVHDRTGREHHRREERRAEEDPAHLFEHDAELEEGEALTAVLLGDVEALQAELVRHLAPHRGVVALGRLHQPSHLARRRLRLEEPTHRIAQLFLLVGEGEVHGGAPGVPGIGAANATGPPPHTARSEPVGHRYP